MADRSKRADEFDELLLFLPSSPPIDTEPPIDRCDRDIGLKLLEWPKIMETILF